MKTIHRSRLLAFAASLGCHLLGFGAEGENDPIQLFKEYLHLDSLLTHQHLAEREAPPHVIEHIKKQRDGIAEDLLRNEAMSGPALASEYEAERAGGGAAMAVQLLNFAMHTGIAKAEFLPLARELVSGTDRDDFRRPMLSTALEYLGAHGEEQDLELMASLDRRLGDAYLQIRDAQAARLKARLSGGAEKERADVILPRTGPDVAGRHDSGRRGDEGKEKLASQSYSGWLLAVLSAAVLATAILFVWTRRRMAR